MTCVHVYQYVNASICPHCGQDTHEPDWKLLGSIITDHYKNGDDKPYICETCNGTIRIWWSI